MKILMKGNYGNLKTLEKLGINRKNDFTTEQLLDENLKNKGGEKLWKNKQLEESN